MADINVDQQGRIVLPRSIRRRLGIDGRAAQLRLVETADGVLLEAPPVQATIVMKADGLPSITIAGLTGPITNDEVLQAIEAERSAR